MTDAYTITGATDWRMLGSVGSITATVVGLITFALARQVVSSITVGITDLSSSIKAMAQDIHTIELKLVTLSGILTKQCDESIDAAVSKMEQTQAATRIRDIDGLWTALRTHEQQLALCQEKREQLNNKIWDSLEKCKDNCRREG